MDLDHAVARQLLEGFADRRATQPGLLHQHRFGHQVSRRQLLGHDQLLDPLIRLSCFALANHHAPNAAKTADDMPEHRRDRKTPIVQPIYWLHTT